MQSMQSFSFPTVLTATSSPRGPEVGHCVGAGIGAGTERDFFAPSVLASHYAFLPFFLFLFFPRPVLEGVLGNTHHLPNRQAGKERPGHGWPFYERPRERAIPRNRLDPPDPARNARRGTMGCGGSKAAGVHPHSDAGRGGGPRKVRVTVQPVMCSSSQTARFGHPDVIVRTELVWCTLSLSLSLSLRGEIFSLFSPFVPFFLSIARSRSLYVFTLFPPLPLLWWPLSPYVSLSLSLCFREF